MNRKEILKFISENNNEHLLDFYNKSYDKLKDLNSRIDKLTLYLIVVVFLYFITSTATIQQFQVGPVFISDISVIVKLLPLLFSYLLFDLVVTSGHKAEVFMVVKFISMSLYKQDINHKDLDLNRHNSITRLIMPFSYSTELSKFQSQKPSVFQSLFGLIVFLPLLVLLFAPFYFEYYMLKVIYLKYYNDNLGKASFYLSIWTILILFYYLVNNAIKSFRENKNELT